MRRLHGLLLIAGMYSAHGQPHPAFDVASIRPSPHIDRGFRTRIVGGPGTADPQRFSGEGLSLRALLHFAYGVQHYQISGPGWLDAETFDIIAKVTKDASREQFRVMLQDLLAERFLMAVHWERRSIAGYDLVVAGKSVRLKRSVEGDSSRTTTTVVNGRYDVQARHMTMDEIASMVSDQVDRPVRNVTGLQGDYDFHLVYMPEFGVPRVRMPDEGGQPVVTPSDAGPSLFEALQQQLGLKLKKKIEMVNTLVIDRAERTPLPN